MQVVRPTPVLRLVNGDDAPRGSVLRRVNTPPPAPAPQQSLPHRMPADGAGAESAAAARIRRENIQASQVAASDPRWLLAVQVAMALEGGRAAIMPPEQRTRLLRVANKMGIGGFDANLVIAIVQDAARHGEPTLAPETMSRLTLVRRSDGTEVPSRRSMWAMLAVGASLGAIVASALIRWIGG